MEEVWIGFEDAVDEEGVVCVNGAAEAEGGVDPGWRGELVWGRGVECLGYFGRGLTWY